MYRIIKNCHAKLNWRRNFFRICEYCLPQGWEIFTWNKRKLSSRKLLVELLSNETLKNSEQDEPAYKKLSFSIDGYNLSTKPNSPNLPFDVMRAPNCSDTNLNIYMHCIFLILEIWYLVWVNQVRLLHKGRNFERTK